MTKLLTLFAAGVLLLTTAPRRAAAIPVFAHRYGYSCQQCHTTIPHLNGFGQRFLRNGFRLPGPAPEDTHALKIALASNLAYTSEPDPTGLSKAIVDEVELLTGGSYGHFSYFGDSYIVDGGRPGSFRDAWASYWTTPSQAGNVLRLKVGNMGLPLPVDPEVFRETENHYAIFDQTVGSNPFRFFDPHFGSELAFGNPNQGLDAHVLVLKSHDPQSGLPDSGFDKMASLQWNMPALTLSTYGYSGSRPLGGARDAFSRYGLGLSTRTGRYGSDVVVQQGIDNNADGLGTFVRSSGGFVQFRWEFSRALAGIVRYDGIEDSAGNFSRSATFAVNRRLGRNARLTVEDVVTHAPATKNTLNAGLLFAY